MLLKPSIHHTDPRFLDTRVLWIGAAIQKVNFDSFEMQQRFLTNRPKR